MIVSLSAQWDFHFWAVFFILFNILGCYAAMMRCQLRYFDMRELTKFPTEKEFDISKATWFARYEFFPITLVPIIKSNSGESRFL